MTDKDLPRPASLGFQVTRRTGMFGAAPATEVKVLVPFGITALAFAIASMAMCVGPAVVEYLLGIEPNSLDPNPHVQAVLMWVLGLVSVCAMWQDRRHHHGNAPVILGALGVAMMMATLYIRYHSEIEALSYAVLLIGAVLNFNAFMTVLTRTVRTQAVEIDALNRELEKKVESQVQQIDRLTRLKQFLAPQVADLVVAEGKDELLDSHRRYIACFFCDIRDFTAMSEDSEPEEVIALLQSYHERVGRLVAEHRGTIGYRAGDGLMAFFNDPIPCKEPVLDAVRLALAVRAAFEEMKEPWSRRGHAIGLGIGIASGYATLGLVGFQGRSDYTAIGGAVNIASRLCDTAAHGQILIAQRAYRDVESRVRAEPLGAIELKGIRHTTEVYNILGVGEPAP
jgi:class 3 adenylate cyclase